MDNFSDRLTLEGAGGQTGDTRSTSSPPPPPKSFAKIWGEIGVNLISEALHALCYEVGSPRPSQQVVGHQSEEWQFFVRYKVGGANL